MQPAKAYEDESVIMSMHPSATSPATLPSFHDAAAVQSYAKPAIRHSRTIAIYHWTFKKSSAYISAFQQSPRVVEGKELFHQKAGGIALTLAARANEALVVAV